MPDPRAFPSSAIDDRFGGMSLAEYYAGQALPAVLVAVEKMVDDRMFKRVDLPRLGAEGAWAVSDAMMAERAKRGEVAE